MNKNKLARQHGFFSWDDFLIEARSARRLKAELKELRGKQAPLERAAAAVAGERVMLGAERAALASAYRDVACFYSKLAVTEEQAAGDARTLARSYEDHAEELESGKTRSELMKELAEDIRRDGGIPMERQGAE